MAFERLILASNSPRRIELLKQLCLSFEVFPASGEEPLPEAQESPAAYVQRVALWKTQRVQQRLRVSDAWIIGADTVVVQENRILGKPGSLEQARSILHALSGQVHDVFTGFALLHQHKKVEYTETVQSKVWFRPLSIAQIDGYLQTQEPMDKAGAYGIQGKGAILVEKIEGCYFNVVGLPLGHLIAALEKQGAGFFF